jgi:hypothetical protein
MSTIYRGSIDRRLSAQLAWVCSYTLTGLSSFCMIMIVLSGEPAALGRVNKATRTFGAAGLALPLGEAAPGHFTFE